MGPQFLLFNIEQLQNHFHFRTSIWGRIWRVSKENLTPLLGGWGGGGVRKQVGSDGKNISFTVAEDKRPLHRSPASHRTHESHRRR